MPETTKAAVETLLENFADYVNPDGEHDPWFTLSEINQQFAWADVSDGQLADWLDELIFEGKVDTTDQDGEAVYRWLS